MKIVLTDKNRGKKIGSNVGEKEKKKQLLITSTTEDSRRLGRK
jgi:hypothetical protein